MDILIAFLIALGLVSSDKADRLSEDQVYSIAQDNHDKLVDEYGDEYLSIVGIDESEKD